ncbi:MAG: transcriptional regulator, partial [Bacteroidota bacterium]
MKEIFVKIKKEFDHRNRLGIMSILMVNDWVDYSSIKEMLGLTDGNLASHIKTLEKSEFIEMKKEFVGRKPQTSYRATTGGKKAFNEHLDALEALI